ncbi:hypothetical protein [Azospirillum argentinense]
MNKAKSEPILPTKPAQKVVARKLDNGAAIGDMSEKKISKRLNVLCPSSLLACVVHSRWKPPFKVEVATRSEASEIVWVQPGGLTKGIDGAYPSGRRGGSGSEGTPCITQKTLEM